MPYLVVENGNRRGFKVEIPEGGTVTFGRDSRVEIPVSDHLCSRRHFEVRSHNGCFTLTDLGSSNGTYVNDRCGEGSEELQHGDCIQAGETQLTFLIDTGQGARGLVGKTIGGYRILERIGRGGMGTVYKANQTSLNRTIALKILSPKIAQDPAFVARFQKEAQAAGRLNHPNIVQVYDVGSDAGLHYYSMEYIENGSVQDLATRDGVLDVDLALAIIIDAARGLEYAEKKNLVHRDIKPDNLMVNAEGVVKIADLGLARDAGRTARETGEHAGEHHEDDEGIFGTPHFISPEQALGKNVDTRSDIYSLGASFYRLVTGETPFKGATVREIVRKQVQDDPVPAREKNREIPAPIAQVIERMMLKDRDERHDSAAHLLEDLEHIAAQLEGGGKKPLIIIAAAFAVVAIITVVIVVTGGKEPAPTPNGGGGGPTNGPPKPPPTPNLTIEALKELNPLQLREASLVGDNRTEDALEKLIRELKKLVDKYAGTEAEASVKPAQDTVTKLVAERDKLKHDREARVAALAKKLEDAKTKADAVIQVADGLQKQEQWGAATLAVLQGLRAKELQGYDPERTRVAAKLRTIIEAARAATSTDQDAAKTLADAGKFQEAAEKLAARALNLREDIDPDGRLDDLRELASACDDDARSILTRQTAKIADDRAHDQRTGFVARAATVSLLRKSFDPEQAKALLELALTDLRTEPWRDLIKRDLEAVAAMCRIRDGFLARVKTQPPNPKQDKVLLPAVRDPSRDVTWGLTKIDAKGFSVERARGQFKETPSFSGFSPGELVKRLFSLRPDPDANLNDVALMFLISGDAAGALAALGGATAVTDLSQRLRHEVEAQSLLAEIRGLEKQAAKNPMQYLNILPRIERFLKEYKDTIAFLGASNGTTSVFDK
ncbi:MAG: hypothetical protein CMJ83_12030 [Planctomycetes bacterium]|nr:hypothetical protein [Planctomycetota bacterium]